MAQVVKLALKGLALNMATELRSHGVAAVAITPGFLRSESMLEGLGVTEGNWRDAGKKDKNFLESESPLFLGRAVAALAQDPNVLNRSGQLLSSWELSRKYKFTDYDGRRPDWGRLAVDFSVLPAPLVGMFRTGTLLQLEWLTAVAKHTRQFLAKIPKATPTPNYISPNPAFFNIQSSQRTGHDQSPVGLHVFLYLALVQLV